jgi:hypothetical protein
MHAPQRAAILTAIDEHDNGWREPDSSPIVDGMGRILDFIAAPDGSGAESGRAASSG